MVATVTVPRLGTGLYHPREAAFFAKLRTETFNRWFFGNARGAAALRPKITPTSDDREDRLVTFVDLIQAVAVRTVRTSDKGSRITLDHVREVVAECESQGIHFPLAKKHAIYWYSNRLVLKIGKDTYIGTKPGIDKSQLYHGLIIEPFLKEVTFSGDYAQSWTPLKSHRFRISLNADRRFGMPVVEPGGILVSAISDAVSAEGSIERAAHAFETEPEAIRLALKYQEYLASPA